MSFSSAMTEIFSFPLSNMKIYFHFENIYTVIELYGICKKYNFFIDWHWLVYEFLLCENIFNNNLYLIEI